MKKFDAEKYLLTKWQLCELRQFFLQVFNRICDCASIGHTQFFLWPMYSDIISLLTITVQGVSNKHCLLPFS